MSRLKLKKSEHAFTIAEILAVVMIIALLAGLGGGMYVGTFKKSLVRRAGKDFLLAAKYARIKAIEQGSSCVIEIGEDKQSFALVVREFDEFSGESERREIRDLYTRPVTFEEDVEFEQVNIEGQQESFFLLDDGENKRIEFAPDGTARNAVVQIGDKKTHFTVVITGSTGQVTMREGTVDEVESKVIDLDMQ